MGDCRHCSRGFDRDRIGAGRRPRRASVQALVLPLPRHWTGCQSQARSSAQRHRGPQGRHLRGIQLFPANKSSGIVWSAEGFDKYIRAPMQEMPGTRMAFVGIKNDKDIADLWAYLKEFGPDGAKK